jgi:putative chitinase
MGNGDEASGDGYRFGGGSVGMLTGREMWQGYATYSRNDVMNHPELFDDPAISADAAAWMFAVAKELIDEADANLVTLISKRINGGTIGLEERKAATAAARAYFVGLGLAMDEPVAAEVKTVAVPVLVDAAPKGEPGTVWTVTKDG